MSEAKFIQNGDSIDITAGSTAIAAGDVVVNGALVGVAKLDIPANTTGSIALSGVYDVVKASGKAVTFGQKVYWTGTAATTDADNGVTGEGKVDYVLLGPAVSAAAAADASIKVKLG